MIDGDVRGAERGDRQHGDDDDRQREERVDDAAEDVVDPAAEVAGDEAQRGTDHRAEDRRQRGHDQDGPRAVDDAREHVAPESVGAEQVVDRRRLERIDRIRRQRVLHDEPAEDRAQHPEAEDRGAGDERLGAAEPGELLAARGAPLVTGRSGRRRRAHQRLVEGGAERLSGQAHSALPRRTRGLSTEYRTSAISVTTTNTRPIRSTLLWSSGKSFACAARKISCPRPL